MCGICGIFHLDGDPVSPLEIRRMSDAIAHRGPDGDGLYVDCMIGFGHRRLAIIDLSAAGHQPMMSADGRHILTYNGEVFNFQELRIELETLGHRFHSRTDSEVVLNAFVEWGEQCVLRFNGMFAFAVWDTESRRLTLARDRYGIKPLYYCRVGDVFLFGSEIKALLAHRDCSARIDEEALLEYFTFQNFLSDRTLFRGVRLLPAGTYMTVGCDPRPVPAPTRYWDFNFHEPEAPCDHREYAEELDRLFRQSVERQLVSDVDVGCYLSGGMDSGSLTAVAAMRLPRMKTFTCGFDLRSASGLELGFDERENAEFMSYVFKTEHYEVVLKAGDLEHVMPRLTRHLEEPRIGQSYPNFYVAQLASRFVKVVLSGAGGDELFGGYPWRYYRAVVNASFEDYIDKYYVYWQRLVSNSVIKQLFTPIWPRVRHVWTRDIFRNVFSHDAPRLTRPEDYVNHSLYFEAKTFLHGLLVVEDKLSMAHGLETRVPFLDNDLVDFAMRVPVRLKLANLADVVRLNENEPGPKSTTFFQRTNDGKLLLRSAMSKYIPSQVISREKQGFSGPDASWFKGDSIEYVKRRLLGPAARLYEFLDQATVHQLVNEHLSGHQNRRLLIWSLLNVESWCEQFG
jgi:asparagine synthase (glutamine-hydrolysing)